MRVLVVNTGSTSVKLRLLDERDDVLERRDLAAQAGRVREEELADALAGLPRADAVGHRVVHGGDDFRAPVVVDGRVLERLRALTELAPLHQPAALAGITALERALPGVAQVACFDTAFHADLPPEAATYAVPRRWREEFGLRRYGFHGLSHAYAARQAGRLLGADPGRLVTAHLGAGASLAAVRDGRSVDTTMGFTPLEGLVMATRAGDVDPGLLMWLLRNGHLEPSEVDTVLERRSGLAGLAGTADMREVTARADGGDPAAGLALAVYLHRLRAKIAAMAAALGGLDTLVFTGGVGEGSPRVRAGAAAGMGFLGLALDPDANAAAAGDAEITAGGAAVRTLVLTAREDLQIAADVRHALGARDRGG
ncbi:acetate/propionate family kinase [Marinitenerispora sediminis]|uniref:Acetate kinase n=1 Tax=Marinitenerispora sediminis TaxID=1931232 RepID=A0A368T9X5_9ACTN|nr:acetate/propionate family kinase [Marinitenerispora sediminis]RCV56858.1 acetate/propionate family kinase [Marinitenerispora sediminis]RCV59031.1 acetate/propionate family kinase [Marinitenerispora sediminis]RCV61567.1 acetate/propionate family kinase [Marinitenerispora sediminis]